jgi:hypothetical protein
MRLLTTGLVKIADHKGRQVGERARDQGRSLSVVVDMAYVADARSQ